MINLVMWLFLGRMPRCSRSWGTSAHLILPPRCRMPWLSRKGSSRYREFVFIEEFLCFAKPWSLSLLSVTKLQSIFISFSKASLCNNLRITTSACCTSSTIMAGNVTGLFSTLVVLLADDFSLEIDRVQCFNLEQIAITFLAQFQSEKYSRCFRIEAIHSLWVPLVAKTQIFFSSGSSGERANVASSPW